MKQRGRTVLALVVSAALTWGVAVVVRLPAGTPWLVGRHGLASYGGLFALFLLGAWLIAGLPRRRAAVVILLGAIALQAASASAPPRTSDDLYRYVWDGRVQAAGIDPYRYVPSAPEVAGLRDPGLWPTNGSGYCVESAAGVATAGCTLINRPLVHTIYPPVAEGYFWFVHMTAGRFEASGIQGAAALMAVAVTVLLLFGLRKLGRDPRYAVLWAWCPTVALEAGNGGHVDVVAVFLTAGALILLARGFTGRGAALLGLAIATKVTPALAAPGAMRSRRPFLFIAMLAGPIAVVYLPHVLAVRSGVLGFFGGYLKEEGYDSGQRFAVLDLVFPTSLVQPAAVVILAAVAYAVWRRGNPTTPWRGALTMTAAAMIVAAPAYPWYAMLLALFVAFEGWRAVPMLAVALGGYVQQVGLGAAWGYGSAAAIIALAYATPLILKKYLVKSPHPIRGLPTLSTENAKKQYPVKTPAAKSSTMAHPAIDAIPTATHTPTTSIDVILPCLNEQQALPYVITRMPAGYHPIVVDNGSTDASAQVARDLGAQVVHESRKGFGAACHAGLLAATADVICILDCDGSFDPQDLPRVVQAILDGTAELSLGQRRPVTVTAWPPHARLANRLLARRIRRQTGVVVRDLGPMRAARRRDLLALDVQDRRFGYPLEMVLKAAADGWRIAEVDVPYAPRTGKSKVTGTVRGTLKAVRDMRKVWKAATQ